MSTTKQTQPTLAGAIRAAINGTVQKDGYSSPYDPRIDRLLDDLRAALPRAEAADELADRCEKAISALRAYCTGHVALDAADLLESALRRYRGQP